jgi:hypothetical protein
MFLHYRPRNLPKNLAIEQNIVLTISTPVELIALEPGLTLSFEAIQTDLFRVH